MSWKRQKIEELLTLINRVRKRDREFRTRFFNAFDDRKPGDIIDILVSLQYLLGKLEDLYDAAAVTEEYVTSERIMEQVSQNKTIMVQGLPHEEFIKAQVIEKIVNRLCEGNLDGNVTIDGIILEAEMDGIDSEEAKKLLGWMKRCDMVDEVEKDVFRSTAGMIPLQPDIVKLMREELRKKDRFS